MNRYAEIIQLQKVGHSENNSDICREAFSVMEHLEELQRRCQALSAPLVRRMATHIVRQMNKSLADQVQSDFARIGMNFFDQMSLLHRERDYADFLFGFEDMLDRMVREEIAVLSELERLALDFRNPAVTKPSEREDTLFHDVKSAFGTLLDEHLQTVKMQKYMERYRLGE